MGCSDSKAAEGKAVQKAAPEGDYKISVERTEDEKRLGLQIAWMSDSTIKILGVKDEGLIPAWNKKNEETSSPEFMVKTGDLIVVVNGVFLNVEAMARELQVKTLAMTLKRAAPAIGITRIPPADAAQAVAADDAPAQAAVSPPADDAAALEESQEAPSRIVSGPDDPLPVAEPVAEPPTEASVLRSARPPAETRVEQLVVPEELQKDATVSGAGQESKLCNFC